MTKTHPAKLVCDFTYYGDMIHEYGKFMQVYSYKTKRCCLLVNCQLLYTMTVLIRQCCETFHHHDRYTGTVLSRCHREFGFPGLWHPHAKYSSDIGTPK